MANATIASGASLSGAVDLGVTNGWNAFCGVIFPATFTGTTASFQVSNELDGTYANLHDQGGTEVTLTVAASRVVCFSEDTRSKLGPWRFLKIRSGTAASPTTEGAERILRLYVL